MIRIKEMIIISSIIIASLLCVFLYNQHQRIILMESILMELDNDYYTTLEQENENVDIFNHNFEIADQRLIELERKVEGIETYLTN